MNFAIGHHELGRRLIAALLSYQHGLSMDYTLETFVPEDVHESWESVGRALLTNLTSEFDPEICDHLRN